DGGFGDDMDFGGGGGGDSGGFDLEDNFDSDEGGGDEGGGEEPAPEPEPAQESVNMNYYLATKQRLAENRKIKEAKRLTEISHLYEAAGNQIYMKFLKENHMKEWSKPYGKHSRLHEVYISPVNSNDIMYESYKVLSNKDSKGKKLKEKK
ncbi:MAG: hypothetical protein HUJ68_10060, partial [Clostridia bacterium]|nr:hypothetical protein [Clostridia bacterium]